MEHLWQLCQHPMVLITTVFFTYDDPVSMFDRGATMSVKDPITVQKYLNIYTPANIAQTVTKALSNHSYDNFDDNNQQTTRLKIRLFIKLTTNKHTTYIVKLLSDYIYIYIYIYIWRVLQLTLNNHWSIVYHSNYQDRGNMWLIAGPSRTIPMDLIPIVFVNGARVLKFILNGEGSLDPSTVRDNV